MKNFIRIMMAVIAVLFIGLHAAAEDNKVITVDAEGTVQVGDDTTIGQAKAAALNNARRAALEKATGIVVHGSSVVYNNQLIDDLVMAATKGIIVKEDVLENRCQAKDEEISCLAKIRAAVKPISLERRANFNITKLTVQRPDKDSAAKGPVFQSGDEIQVRAAASEDSYLNIFSVDQNGGIVKIYPNEYGTWKRFSPDTELVFPTDSQRKNGLRLKVRPPKGVKTAVESVLVIATREKLKLLKDSKIENPTITDLMRELSEIDPSQWVESSAGYEVRE